MMHGKIHQQDPAFIASDNHTFDEENTLESPATTKMMVHEGNHKITMTFLCRTLLAMNVSMGRRMNAT
jgi:hypothetical protein